MSRREMVEKLPRQIKPPPSSAMVCLLFVVPFLLTLALSGCSGSNSVVAPASPEAGEIAKLFWGVLGLSAVIFVVVEGLLVFAVLRFRNRPGAGEPNQVHGNFRLEIAWTLAPALVVVGLFAAMVQPMFNLTEQKPGALRVKVVGYQWWWRIEYPDMGITSATDLHVPVGQPVEVELVAGDVIHSFWAPGLFGKTDVLPGHSTRTLFTADREGIFRGQCAEFCGGQHANMGFLVIAEPREEFEEWVEESRSSKAAAAAEASPRGAQAFVAGGCIGCHAVEGTVAQGKIGPDLTHFGSRKTIAALTLDNTPDNLASWLADPQSIKPGNKMPKLGLSPEAIQDLATYLRKLK